MRQRHLGFSINLLFNPCVLFSTLPIASTRSPIVLLLDDGPDDIPNRRKVNIYSNEFDMVSLTLQKFSWWFCCIFSSVFPWLMEGMLFQWRYQQFKWNCYGSAFKSLHNNLIPSMPSVAPNCCQSMQSRFQQISGFLSFIGKLTPPRNKALFKGWLTIGWGTLGGVGWPATKVCECERSQACCNSYLVKLCVSLTVKVKLQHMTGTISLQKIWAEYSLTTRLLNLDGHT